MCQPWHKSVAGTTEVRLTCVSTCAALSRAQEEPLGGTAAFARTWLLVEQPGPWGPRALTQSRLDPVLGKELETAAEAVSGVRVALIRRPGRHADTDGTGQRRVFAAHTAPGRSWVRTAVLDGPEALRGLDLAALAAGAHGGLWEPHRGAPLALICTNGRRDRCCAVLGRGLAGELTASGGCEVWEITHLGGHRFSPTLLVLPHGYAYGRATAPGVKGVVAALQEGRVVADNCRGRSCWDRPGQAAELAVRALTGEDGCDALTVTAAEAADGDEAGGERGAGGDARAPWTVTVAHVDGRRWHVTVEEDAAGPGLPASCGALPQMQPHLVVTGATRLP